MSIYNKTEEQLLLGTDSVPGRGRTFLLRPQQKTTPHSCTRYHWDGNIDKLLTFAAHALKGGCGVKITFPTNTALITPRPLGEWKVWIDPSHPEYAEIANSGMLSSETNIENIALTIEDSIEGIAESWSKIISYKDWSGLVINLSKIRPKGTQNSNGLIASGAMSFLLVYKAIAEYLENGTIESLIRLLGTLNGTMRRGGYKKGIITTSMSSQCPLIVEYLQIPNIEINGSHKKGVIVYPSILQDIQLAELVIDSRNKESTFFEKPCEEGLGWNVCVGLQLAHLATCLIWRINLGMCKISDIRSAFCQGATNACELHTTWREKVPHLARHYATLENDRQIGLDVMGLANLLAIEEVTYAQFADALEYLLNPAKRNRVDNKALEIATEIHLAYQDATNVCDNYMLDRNLPLLDRIFTIEPAQNHAYSTFDRLGKTTCRGIFPPTGRVVHRTSTSGAEKNKRYFHGSVQTDVMVGIPTYERVCDLWQETMNKTGRAHGISQDSWRDMDLKTLEDFILKRPSQTLYYQETDNYNQRGFLAKTVQRVEMQNVGIRKAGSPIEIVKDEDIAVCDPSRPGECLACAD